MNEIRYIQNNRISYYKRGSLNNNINYDDAYIKFNQDGTGLTRWGGDTYSFTWKFSNIDHKNLTYTLSNNPSFTVNWEGISYSDTLIKYTEYYTYQGVNSLAQASRTPKVD